MTALPVFTAGVVQLQSGRNPNENFRVASALIQEAANRGADFVLTPENTLLMEHEPALFWQNIAPEEANPQVAAFMELARQLKIWLNIGSIAIRVSENKAANRSYLINPDGYVIATYDKIHLFDVDLGNGESYRESDLYTGGNKAVLAMTPWGRLGMSICYDLRFPALYRRLAKAGASFLAIPAAFTKVTGQMHWHILNCARAIENGCFVLSAAQCGRHENGRETYGHSLIIDPWGQILAEAKDNSPGIIMAEIDTSLVTQMRRNLPSIHHDRLFQLESGNVSATTSYDESTGLYDDGSGI